MKNLSYALQKLDNIRLNNEQKLSRKRSEIYAIIPEILKIDNRLKSMVLKLSLVAFDNNGDVEANILKMQDEYFQKIAQKKQILVANGFPENYLDQEYSCNLCQDTGYIETEVCSCVKELCKKISNEKLSKVLDIKNQSFDNFNFELYSKIPDLRYNFSPFDNIIRNFEIIRKYAENFSLNNNNLLFSGNPGLSKTYLSTCVSNTVVNMGFSVVYDTIINILNNYERSKFSQFDINIKNEIDSYKTCDLLIIDDLGTELVTNFTISALYTLINDRIMAKKPMIINTNLSLSDIYSKYTPAIASRIDGEFRHIIFFGDDVRKKLK